MLYDYMTPPGYGDTFFQFVFDAQGAGLTDGQDYFQKGIPVDDGQFVMRYWSGLGTIAEGLQVYDWLGRRFGSDFMTIGSTAFGSRSQMVVLPEVVYPENGNIRFDLQGVAQAADGAASQLVFTGVRRRKGVVGDPVPANYRYYEKEYAMPYTLTVPSTAGQTVQVTIPVQDYDFEIRRIEMNIPDSEAAETSGFKVLLYDTNWVQVANKPVLCNQFFHLNQNDGNWAGQLGFWPCPPMLYRVNSVIRFDVTAVSGFEGEEYEVLFKGVRRIPCS